MIRRLKLKNWKSHESSEFKFGEGTNVLVGIMGSGKSSVLSAISFALFGTFPALRSREVTLDEVIMERPQRREEAMVEAEFEMGDNNIQVKRKIERGKGTTEAEIRRDGKLLDSGTTRVTELVEKELKVDYELFSQAVYSEQDELDYFLEIPKGQRMKRIDNLLRIDKFEKCRSNTTTLINRLSDRIESRKEMVEKMEEEEDFEKIQELESEIKNLEEKEKDEKEELEEKEKQYEKTEKELEELKEGLEELKKLENRKNSLEGAISSVEEEVESLRKEVELSKEELDGKIEEKEEKIEKKEERKEEIEEELEKLNSKKQEIEVKIEDLQKRIQKLKSVEGECPICGSELDEEHKREVEEERRDKISGLADRREEIQDKVEGKERDGKEIESELEELEESKDRLKRKLEKAGELVKREGKLESKKGKLESVEKELEEKGERYDQERIEEKQEKLEKLSGDKKELQTEIKSDKKFLKEKKNQVKELKERKETFEKYKEEISRSKELNQDLKKFKNSLKETQKDLRRHFIEAVNRTLGKVWDRLYPYDDFTNLRLTIKEEDYELQFRSAGDWQSVEGIASGGERTSACLALRIAFALVLAPNLKWLVLDEPTHNLDRRTVEDLAELLRTKVSELVDQVFLITHNQSLESAANAYLYKLEREKEGDEPTQVQEVT